MFPARGVECFALGVALIVYGLLAVCNDDFFWRDVIVPRWAGWLGLALGFAISLIGWRVMRQEKGKPEPPPITDEEFAKLETELDAAYLREYGEPPEKPKQPEKKQ